MPYSRGQYPFDQYDKEVAKLKRRLDHDAISAYPMVARVTDASGQVLSECTYQYVHDRKSQYVELVTQDWEAPVTITFLKKKRDEELLPLGSVRLEKVTVQPAEIQLDCFDILAE
jgi:hypothetical protein